MARKEVLTDPLDIVYSEMVVKSKWVSATKSDREGQSFLAGASEALYAVAEALAVKAAKKSKQKTNETLSPSKAS